MGKKKHSDASCRVSVIFHLGNARSHELDNTPRSASVYVAEQTAAGGRNDLNTHTERLNTGSQDFVIEFFRLTIIA